MLDEARKSLKTVQTELQPHLNRSSDNVQQIVDRNQESDTKTTNINHALDQITIDSQTELWQNARDQAIDAQEKAQDALGILKPIVNDLPIELERAKQMPKAVDDTNNDIAQARNQVDRIASLLPSVTKLFKDLDSKQDDISRLHSDLGDRLEKLKEQIDMARVIANGIKVGVRFYPNTTLELPPPQNLPLLEASSQISTYFKTDKPDGFLFYLGNENKTGKDDFMALEVENGYPILTVDLGNGSKKIISNKHVANDQWHQVIVERTGNDVKLIVREELPNGKDEFHEVRDTVPGNGEFNVDTKKSKLFVGGYPPDFMIQDGIRYSAFEGEIEDFRIGDQEVGLWNFVDGQDNNHGAMERNQLQSSELPATGYRFSGNGYVTLDSRPYAFKQRSNIQFKFKVARDTTDGLIFYAGKHRHFISIEMRDGAIFFKYKLGQHMVKIGSDQMFNDDQWHLVEAVRDGRSGILKVDRNPIYQEETTLAGTEENLKITDLMYFGGYPGKLNHTEITQKNFDGCIDEVYISGTPVDLSHHRQAYGVRPGCPTKVSTVLSYPPRQFGYLRRGNVSSDNHFQINLKFQSRQKDGLLFYATNHDQSSTIGLALQDGSLVLRSMKQELSTGNVKYNNGDWHVVRVIHDAKKLRLKIDDTEEGSSDFENIPLYIDHGDIYFGGLPKGFKTPKNVLATTAYFVGCIKDVSLSGQTVNFANSTDRKSAVLDNCSPDILDYDAAALPIIYPEDDIEPIVRFSDVSATNEIASPSEIDRNEDADEEEEQRARERQQQENEENARRAAAEETARKEQARKDEEAARRAAEEEENRKKEAIAAEAARKAAAAAEQEKKIKLDDRFNELDGEDGEDAEPTLPTTTTTTTPRPVRTKRPYYDKPEPICKLPAEPEIDVDFDAGYRFGTSSDSRIEFSQIPAKIKKSYSISLQFRTNEPDGVLFYAADSRHTDFIALYLQNGKVSPIFILLSCVYLICNINFKISFY